MPNAYVPSAEVETLYSRMSRLLGVPLRSESDAIDVVARGISPETYKRLAERLDLSSDLVAPSSTVHRRISNNRSFTKLESERIVRLIRIFAEAVELFGEESAALDWLKTPADYLEGKPPITPMALSMTDAGARLVEAHIRRTAFGIY